jgi:hypothetical protein
LPTVYTTALFALVYQWSGKELPLTNVKASNWHYFTATVPIRRYILNGKNTSVSINRQRLWFGAKMTIIFPADGAYPYKRDLQDIEFHLLDTGHFALL